MVLIRWTTAAVLALAALTAAAADIRDASYDAERDEIVVKIAYRGTNPDHDFTVQWGPCFETGGPPAGVVGRLVDQQGEDIAREEFRVTERIGLGGLACRPAVVTLRLGKVSHMRVYVPAAPNPKALQ